MAVFLPIRAHDVEHVELRMCRSKTKIKCKLVYTYIVYVLGSILN